MGALNFLLIASLLLAITAAETNHYGDARLVDGNSDSEGRVEVYNGGDWGTVCDDGWDLIDGTVVCKQLGYVNASEVLKDAYFGEGERSIVLQGLDCDGTETNLTQCPQVIRKKCEHVHDAGVRCWPSDDSSGGGLSPLAIGAIVLIPFLILIVSITVVIIIMIYLTFNYDREAEEEEERKFQAKRFLKGISLKEQNRSRGRKGIFRSRRKSGDSHMSQSSSYVERMKIPRGSLGDGVPHPWQVTEEVETDVDEEEEVFQLMEEACEAGVEREGGEGRTKRVTVVRTVEAINPAVVMKNGEDIETDKESPEIPDRYKKRPLIDKEEEVETEDDSDINPYEEVEI